MTHRISNTVTHAVVLGYGGYGSRLVISETDAVLPALAGADAIMAPSFLARAGIQSEGSVVGAVGVSAVWRRSHHCRPACLRRRLHEREFRAWFGWAWRRGNRRRMRTIRWPDVSGVFRPARRVASVEHRHQHGHARKRRLRDALGRHGDGNDCACLQWRAGRRGTRRTFGGGDPERRHPARRRGTECGGGRGRGWRHTRRNNVRASKRRPH